MGKFVKGLLFGALTGAAGGLLLAPKSGDETRQQIKDQLDDVKDQIDDVTESTMEVNESLKQFKGALETTLATAQEVLPAFSAGLEKDLRKFQFQAEPRIAQINEQLEVLQSHLPEMSSAAEEEPEADPAVTLERHFPKQ